MNYIEGSLKITIFTILLSLIIVVTIYCVCAITILPQSPDTNRERAIFDFYHFMAKEASSQSNQTYRNIIYFIGSSQMESGLNTYRVEEDLIRRNISAEVFNLGISGDTPSRRLKELPALITSQPDIVVLGVTYAGFHDDSQQGLSTSAMKNDSTSLSGAVSFFNQGPKMCNYFVYGAKNPIQSKKMFKSGTDFGTPSLSVLKERHDEVVRRVNPEKGTPFERELFFSTVVTENDNSDKKSFKYFVQELEENNISVIIINMPINPMLSEKIPDSTRRNYSYTMFAIANDTGASYFDDEKLIPEEGFRDVLHFSTNMGNEYFSHEMARLIESEKAKR